MTPLQQALRRTFVWRADDAGDARYDDRHEEFGFRRHLLRAGDRVLMVDDWAATGATALAVRALVEDSGARWPGVAAVVDALEDGGLRRRLPLRALLHLRDL